MTIQERLRRSNFIMLVVPVLIAGMLLLIELGVLVGVGASISAIRTALQKHRSAMAWLVLGLIIGSLYAIANGPASLDNPLPPLSPATFRLPAFVLGVALLLALEGLKHAMEKKEGAAQ